MTTVVDNVIKVGDYIVVQRWNFMKIIHLGGNKGCDFDVVLGNDIVNIVNAVGKPYWSTFKLITQTNDKKGKKRRYTVEVCDKGETADLNAELIKDMTSGSDNRDIKDDGKSQNLSTENIHELRDCGKSAQDIVEQLIENSTTFQKKTEYAQEKYLSKKKKKYFDYILLRPTSLRLMIEINNKKDTSKYLGITMDTLSHMITACNIQPGGKYLTYENGGSGIISAMILNYMDTTGKVIQVHPGPYPQKSSVLSLNLSNEKMDCYVPISVRDMIEVCKSLQKQRTCMVEEENVESKASDKNSSGNSTLEHEIEQFEINDVTTPMVTNTSDPEISPDGSKLNLKRKNSEADLESYKKSCYANDVNNLKSSVENLLSDKVDGLIIACKEHPNSVLFEFIKYVAPSRPIIVYSLYREPLEELFLELKTSKYSVINVRLTESFLRSYQVLPERTHPHMSKTSTGGYLLTATVVEKGVFRKSI